MLTFRCVSLITFKKPPIILLFMAVWIQKYVPKSLSEVAGQNSAVERLRAYAENYKRGTKPLFLYGGQGTGKTSSVHALAKDLDYEILEVNASDVRNADSINSLLGAGIHQMSLFGRGKIILVDEVDGLSGKEDRGGVAAITSLIVKSSYPIFLTANDPWNKKLATLRKKCELLEFRTLAYTSITNHLKKICELENITYDESALQELARAAGGDLRAAINDLQTFSYEGKLTKENIKMAYSRDHTETIINALTRVFKTTKSDVALPAFDEVQEDLDTIFLWIEENIPVEYKKPEDLAEAFSNLALADVFRGRIRRWQYYRFYVYCYNLLSAGIALSKNEKYSGFTSYQRSGRILKIWMSNQKNLKKKAISQKIAEKTHSSKKTVAQDVLPYIKMIFKKNKEEAERLSKYFDLASEEITWLKA
mgnify:FL=1